MLRAIAIDDEKAALSQLKKVAATSESVDIVAVFTNPLEGFESIATLEPNVVFLDIDMPEMSGICMAEQILKCYPGICIVFVTSYNDYAQKAFDLDALDYLLKPFTQERFFQCIDKILKYNDVGTDARTICSLNHHYKESVKKFFIHSEGEIVLIKPDDIYYFEARNKTVIIKTLTNTYTSSNTLKYFENKMQNSNFFRCHRSYLVNLDKVSRFVYYSKSRCDVGFDHFRGTIPVSRQNIELIQKLLQY